MAMPTYEYQAVDPSQGCEQCRARFEVQQSMRDAALEHCPQCGAPVVRLISAPGICTQSERGMLSDGNLKRLGMKKLVNEGGGKFRRVT